jgi:hypothetical protein
VLAQYPALSKQNLDDNQGGAEEAKRITGVLPMVVILRQANLSRFRIHHHILYFPEHPGTRV